MAIAQEMPTGKHEHIKSYDLEQLKKDILNNSLFGFVQVDIETPKKLYTPLLKWYLQQGLKITKFHCAIKYTPEKSFQQFCK